jgi:FKBP-type peptidyl-prolyl cis-trans isomerase
MLIAQPRSAALGRQDVEFDNQTSNKIMRTILLPILVLLIFVPPVTPDAPATASVSSKKRVKTKSGLIYEVMVKGKGSPAKRGETVRIHETLSLRDGRVIYSSRSKNEPVKFLLGGNQVIAAVDEGVTGMRVGERRKLIVPPFLAGRTSDSALIPPGSTLHYDVELLEIVK